MGLSAELRIADAGRSPLARGLRWTASTRPGAWVFARTVHHLDPIALRASPLVAVVAGEHVAVIGSNFGRPTHPERTGGRAIRVFVLEPGQP
jgi:hypothetical protein